MKKVFFALVLVTSMAKISAQNVFTYGKKAVSKDEFLKAFNKNPVAGTDRKKALEDYLDLYINFRLKVQAAYDAGLDKDPNQQLELDNFKKQLADNVINNEANIKDLVKQAFERSQKEIHLQQIFVEVGENSDTTEAYKKIQTAYKQILEGKDFAALAQELAVDEATKQSKGDLGYITVFILPYPIENEVYALKANSFSPPVRSKVGYHIFKNAGERKSLGSRRIAQILVTMPPGPTTDERAAAARKADSLYNLLQGGADFGALATEVSNDLSTSNNKGELPEFTIGAFNADFENVAFSLKNPGEISKPFHTAYGIHILKLLEAKPAPADLNDPVTISALQEKVTRDKRLELSKKALIRKKLALLKYTPLVKKRDDLFVYTDSAMVKGTAALKGINQSTPLFSFARQTVKAEDWLKFVKNTGNFVYPVKKERYTELFEEYVNSSADLYYRNNLEAYSAEFVKQVKEFKEANLLFGIMEKNVWGKANRDTSALSQYYNQHKSKYIWPASADAIIVTCIDEKVAHQLRQKLKDNVQNWREITASMTDISVDSARFELGQLPVVEKTHFTPGLLTETVSNQDQGTYTFNYVIKVYKENEQKSFTDARGTVISDYQTVVEDNWMRDLKKKYPVVINQSVFHSIK